MSPLPRDEEEREAAAAEMAVLPPLEAAVSDTAPPETVSTDDLLAQEAEELDGYFSDTPLNLQPIYPPPLRSEVLDETAVIITNLPRVSAAKMEKLTKVLLKLVSRIGPLAVEEDTGYTGVIMPFDDAQQSTLGFCWVEYQSTEHAKNAVEVLQGYKFDKNHILSVTSYGRARQLQAVDTTQYVHPEPEPFVEKPNTMQWLEDPDQRDAFVLRYGTETAVYWSDGKTDPVLDYDGAREKQAGVQWCEHYCYWSPTGSYLATLVPARGVILWAGPNYDKVGRFVAPGVKTVSFSPRETYLLTNNERADDPAAIKVYHVATGKLLRAFPLFPDPVAAAATSGGSSAAPASLEQQEGDEGGRTTRPPPFSWSHDDQYLARQGPNLISIYETPGMHLLDRRSLNCPGIREFQWSPQANILAYWAPEDQNTPAHVDLIEIPSRKKLRQKNLFSVTHCSMVWQDKGEYLAVKVTRHTKSKKTLFNNIELFRLNQAAGSVPVEMLDTKDAVMSLQWEPNGSRFAMIHAENPSAAKVKVSFYDMTKPAEPVVVATTLKKATATKGKAAGQPQQPASSSGSSSSPPQQSSETRIPELNLLETLEGKQCNCLFWSPAGGHIIMASLGDSSSGTLEFYDVDNKTMVIKEHYRANQLLWDPSGRTVVTLVSQPLGGGHFKFAMDNGFVLWSFQGKQLYQQSYETFYQFLWRPRESLLSREEIEKVKKNLKKYEQQFDRADRRRQRLKYLEETQGKRAQRAQYREVLERNRAIRTRERARHVELLGGFDSEDDSNYVIREMTVETILSTKEEIVM